jgi:hypothetical protein
MEETVRRRKYKKEKEKYNERMEKKEKCLNKNLPRE